MNQLAILLSQVAPPPEGVEAWLKIFFWLVGGCTGCVVIYNQLTGKGDKQIVEVHGRIKRERMEIELRIAKLETSYEKLDVRIDAVPGRVISLLRETKGLI